MFIQLEAVGVAAKDPFVVETLPAINKILNQEYVLLKYAEIFDKKVEDVKQVLAKAPQIRYSTVKHFNAFVGPDSQINDERVYGWVWANTDAMGFDWSNYLNVNILYFPRTINSLDEELKRDYQVFFVTIVLHELTHWLGVALDAKSPSNPYPEGPILESGENLELDLLGGRMASYYYKDHGDSFRIDGVVLGLCERGKAVSESPCRTLSENYYKFFFEDMEKLMQEVETMRMNSNSGLPTGASFKTPICGCEAQGNVFTSQYQVEIAHRSMNDKIGRSAKQ